MSLWSSIHHVHECSPTVATVCYTYGICRLSKNVPLTHFKTVFLLNAWYSSSPFSHFACKGCLQYIPVVVHLKQYSIGLNIARQDKENQMKSKAICTTNCHSNSYVKSCTFHNGCNCSKFSFCVSDHFCSTSHMTWSCTLYFIDIKFTTAKRDIFSHSIFIFTARNASPGHGNDGYYVYIII